MLSAGIHSKSLYSSTEAVERECEAYCEHIQNVLSDSPAMKKYLPFSTKTCNSLLSTLQDGIVLAHLIEKLKPNGIPLKGLNYTIEMSTLGQRQSKAIFEVGENLNTVVDGAKKLKDLGVVIVNLGANDILEKNVDIVLGLVWQLVRAHLLRFVNLVDCPALIRLLQPGETLKDLVNLSSEKILIRWLNYHLRKGGVSPIDNFSMDIADGYKYIALFQQVAPASKSRQLLNEAANCADDHERVKLILEFADLLGVRDFVTVKDVIAGHARLNMAFVAGIFNKYVGIHLPSDKELKSLYSRIDELESENVDLKKIIDEKDSEIGMYVKQIESLKLEWDEIQRSFIEETNTKVTQLREQHAQQFNNQEKEFQAKIKSIKSDYDVTISQREAEMKSIVEALKAKQKQQIYTLEREHAAHIQKISKEVGKVKTGIEDFMLENNVSFQSEDTPADIESLPNIIQSYLTDVFAEFYRKAESSVTLEKKVQHLAHVNDVFGEKIQEYAETKAQERKSKNFKAKSFFGL